MIHGLGSSESTFVGLAGDQEAIQPNAFDFRVNEIYAFSSEVFSLSKDDKKQHRAVCSIERDPEGYWNLGPGSYSVLTNIDCTIAPGEAGWLIPRSSLNRNGVFLTSGLYDSGFNNTVGCTLHVTPGCTFRVEKGARIGQFIIVKAEMLHLYNGSYNKDSK